MPFVFLIHISHGRHRNVFLLGLPQRYQLPALDCAVALFASPFRGFQQSQQPGMVCFRCQLTFCWDSLGGNRLVLKVFTSVCQAVHFFIFCQ